MFQAILEKIAAYDTIILHRHSKPDGDAIGSQVGLKHLILENFPGKKVYMVGDEAGRYSFMADSVMDDVPDETYRDALAVILDTAAAHLISDHRYTLAADTARMDHHIFCEKIANVELVDTSYESCCGLVADLARQCGWKLNLMAATSLFTGMATDSGRFRYDATTSRTFALASYLMQQPIDTDGIYANLYASDFDQVQLRARFALKVALTENRVAYIYTTKEEIAQQHLDPFQISRAMVGVMSDIRGVDIWVNFTETEENVLCELRSTRHNINPVAVKYGGGGHKKASGATVRDRETAMAMLNDLDKMMGENQ